MTSTFSNFTAISILLLVGLIAGGLVNWVADSVPAAAKDRRGQQPRLRRHPSFQRNRVVCLATFGLSWLAQAQLGWTPQALLLALEAWFFLAIAVIDLEHQLVPNRMVGPALPLFFTANLLLGHATFSSLLVGGVVGAGLFLIIALVVPGAMGMGDVKLTGLIGATVGLTNVLIALYIAIILGGLVAIVLVVQKRLQRNVRMAYAPYLVLGAWLVLFNGQTLLYAALFQR